MNNIINIIFSSSGLTPAALQALCKLVTMSEAGEQLIHKVCTCYRWTGICDSETARTQIL